MRNTYEAYLAQPTGLTDYSGALPSAGGSGPSGVGYVCPAKVRHLIIPDHSTRNPYGSGASMTQIATNGWKAPSCKGSYGAAPCEFELGVWLFVGKYTDPGWLKSIDVWPTKITFSGCGGPDEEYPIERDSSLGKNELLTGGGQSSFFMKRRCEVDCGWARWASFKLENAFEPTLLGFWFLSCGEVSDRCGQGPPTGIEDAGTGAPSTPTTPPSGGSGGGATGGGSPKVGPASGGNWHFPRNSTLNVNQ